LHFKDQAHGIKTDLFAIERYVEEIKAEVLSKLARYYLNLNLGNPKDFLESLS